MRNLRRYIIILIGVLACHAKAEDGFDIRQLPPGKKLTLPRPALARLPLNESLTVASTDMPQILKLSLAATNMKSTVPVKVEVHDRKSKQVLQINVQAGTPYLYRFKKLGKIKVVPVANETGDFSSQLLIESNKPLELIR